MLLAVSAGPSGVAQARANDAPRFRHGYFLFLAEPPVACEACYVPMLLTVDSIEDIARRAGGQDAVLITTYERDSIFQVDGMVHITPGDIQSPPRILRVRKRSYRYQEIAPSEVLRLLEHPQGTIPISRPMLHSDLPPAPSLEQLSADFRAVK